MNLENSRDYYGKVLSQSADLRTDACVTAEAPPLAVRQALANVHPDVKARYYGCGLIAPSAIEGARILDLGSGSGQDAYILAQLVGEHGEVVGVDTTPEQLAVASAHLEWHRERFGYAQSNVRFLEGDIERLDQLLGGAPADQGDEAAIGRLESMLAKLRGRRPAANPAPAAEADEVEDDMEEGDLASESWDIL